MKGVEMKVIAGSPIQEVLNDSVILIENLHGLTDVDFVWFTFNGEVAIITRFTDINLVLKDYLS